MRCALRQQVLTIEICQLETAQGEGVTPALMAGGVGRDVGNWGYGVFCWVVGFGG